MRHFLRLSSKTPAELEDIWRTAAALEKGQGKDLLRGQAVALFFPLSSLRTRLASEKGVAALGGQPLLFPPETLDKREALGDVAAYMANEAVAAVVRHPDPRVLEALAAAEALPIVNAMTAEGHPCEVLSDLYALSKRRPDYRHLRYLYVGKRGNVGQSWLEASRMLGFAFTQCCPAGYDLPGAAVTRDLPQAMRETDVVLTDSLSPADLPAFAPYQVTRALLETARPGVLFNPCPPFFRGEEATADALESPAFVGPGFKRALLPVQQAVLLHCLQRDAFT